MEIKAREGGRGGAREGSEWRRTVRNKDGEGGRGAERAQKGRRKLSKGGRGKRRVEESEEE